MDTTPLSAEQRATREGRIAARPHPARTEGPLGLHPLSLGSGRDSWIYVPQRYQPRRPAPLIVSLHGAGGEGRNHLGRLRPLADRDGLILLAPTAREHTWDVIYGRYGPDVATIDQALEETFSSYAIDPEHLAVEGFSDGASYALSVGLTNGDLFRRILAFSPGFMAPVARRGTPRIFISHGTQDPVLRIDACSRRLVPQLERAGYDVRYVEFSGRHTVPESIAEDGIRWLLELPEASSAGDKTLS
jgi:phospholipase/carboxylesterase